MYYITLKDGTEINIFYINPDFKKYDITDTEGDILPSDLAEVVRCAKKVIIGYSDNNMNIKKSEYENIFINEYEDAEWELKAGDMRFTLYEDSCNQIHCINDSELLKQYIIKLAYIPFGELSISLLMR